jgi:hypothetical protein
VLSTERAVFYPHQVSLSRSTGRQIYRCPLSTSARQTARHAACVSDGDVSLSCKRSVGVTKSILLTGLSIIHKPLLMSRFLSDQSAIFLSDNSLVLPLFLAAKAYYKHPAQRVNRNPDFLRYRFEF